MKTNNEIFELAQEYLEFVDNDCSTNTFNIWVMDKNLSSYDSQRVFLTSISLSMPKL